MIPPWERRVHHGCGRRGGGGTDAGGTERPFPLRPAFVHPSGGDISVSEGGRIGKSVSGRLTRNTRWIVEEVKRHLCRKVEGGSQKRGSRKGEEDFELLAIPIVTSLGTKKREKNYGPPS